MGGWTLKQERRGGIETDVRPGAVPPRLEGSRNAVVALKHVTPTPTPFLTPGSRNAVVALKQRS